MHPMTRRQFLRSLALGLGLPIAGFGYAHLVEAEWLNVSHHKVKLPNLNAPKPIRILHLSDFHFSRYVSLDFIRSALITGLREKPDLICLTGDYYNRRILDLPGFQNALKLLSQAAPTYAVPGNHDGGDWVKGLGGYQDLSVLKKVFRYSGIKFLLNRSETISLKGRTLQVTGLGDQWGGSFSPVKAFAPNYFKSKLPTILLAHNPDTKAFLERYRWDLMLCGHTHGGQLYIPFVGAPFAPVRDKDYISGLKSWKDRQIYITKGIGNLLGMRINCRPEVSILHVA